MSSSIYYSLSLPPTVSVDDAENKLTQLSEAAIRLAEKTEFKVGDVRRLTKADIALSQATMNDDFDFARSACQPPMAKRKSALGEVPDVALYFRIWGASKVGVPVGIARYEAGAQFQMLADDGDTETPYDDRWYYWTFISSYPKERGKLLRAVLKEAERLGFETTYRNEMDE